MTDDDKRLINIVRFVGPSMGDVLALCNLAERLDRERAEAEARTREACARIAEDQPLPGEPSADEAAAIDRADRRMLVYGTVKATKWSIAAAIRAAPLPPKGTP